MAPLDVIGNEAFSSLDGDPLVVLDASCLPATLPAGAILIAVDRAGTLPSIDPACFDVVVTTCEHAPAPWVFVRAQLLDARLAKVRGMVAACPVASTVLARVLRIGEAMAFEDALDMESLAYSTLLGGGEFAGWLAARGAVGHGAPHEGLVRYERENGVVTLTLTAPASRNAMTAAMRDALYEALANVLDDPSLPRLVLRAEGACFSTGGHLPEFGTARDPARAHVIRTQRSCARLLHRLGSRAEVRLHGACIGSGLEVPAAAARRIGTPDLFLQLPELGMGLIPGAGGTVSVARAIGRHRTMWMTLGAFRVRAAEALGWGLLHAIEP